MDDKILIWTNPPKSGLCDRLIDFSLMATLAKLNNSKFSTKWVPLDTNSGNKAYYHASEKNENGENLILDNSGIHCKLFKEVRYNDYKSENFLKYFTLPEKTYIDLDETNLTNITYYDGYLGGNQSPKLFYEKFVTNGVSEDGFINEFYNLCNGFKPTKKLLDISKVSSIPNLVIHLRREDKVRLTDDSKIALDYRELDVINDLTKKTINTFLEKKPNSKILFCSDDIDEKVKWEQEYKNNIIKTPSFDYDYEQTYYDIYIMSISDNILLSQRYSGFSMFASFINKKNFIYLLKDSQIVERKYSELENFYYYEDWLKTL
jgi:hypothetical protein